MPLTPAQRQARVRTRRREKLERYEAALREIAGRGQAVLGSVDDWAREIADAALTPGEPR